MVSRWADLGGPLHYLDFGGPAGGPLIVCVHGLGGSAANWVALAPLLTGGCRVVAPDLAGHGLTQSRGRGTGVAANRALLHRFLASVANELENLDCYPTRTDIIRRPPCHASPRSHP